MLPSWFITLLLVFTVLATLSVITMSFLVDLYFFYMKLFYKVTDKPGNGSHS